MVYRSKPVIDKNIIEKLNWVTDDIFEDMCSVTNLTPYDKEVDWKDSLIERS